MADDAENVIDTLIKPIIKRLENYRKDIAEVMTAILKRKE